LGEKQLDALLGISRNMEKSLANIEKSMSDTGKGGGKAAGVLSGLAQGVGSLVAALSVKKFDDKKANTILEFSRGLVQIVNSVDASKAKDFGEFATGMSAAFETIISVVSPVKLLKLKIGTAILFGGKKPLIQQIAEGMQKAFANVDAQKVKDGATAIKEMGEGLLSLSKAMTRFALIALVAPLVVIGALVVRAVIGMFVSLGKRAKEIEAGGNAIKALGKGLAYFSAGLAALVLVVMIANPMRIAGAIAVLALFALTFALMGKVSWNINRGARAVAKMGLALWGFSIGLATFMLVLLIVKPAMVLTGITVIAAFGVLFALLGIDKIARQIAQGALLMIGMAYALFLFSGGLMVFGLAIKLYQPKDLLMGALVIAEIGLAMALLGRYEKSISKGAFVMAEMGVGLALFSIGLLVFGLAVKLFDFKDIIVGALLIAGLGVAFGIVGLMASEVFVGAIAVAEMGVALISLSIGLILFGVAIKILSALFDDLSEAGKIAGGILLGLGLAFAIIGALSAAIAPGAAAMITVGIALISISVGIILFGLAIKALQALFGDDLREAGMIAGGILLGLGLAFAALGLLSLPIALGAVATLLMGASLIGFSVGLLIFSGAAALLMKVFNTDKLDLIGNSVKDFLVNFGLAFSAVGLLIVPIALGSAAVMLMGSSLILFGAGLLVFGAAMYFIDSKGLFVNDAEGRPSIRGVDILPSIAAALTDVGLYAFNPLFWSGVAASIGMGASLVMIGSGLMLASESLEKTKDINGLVNNLFGDGGLIPVMAESYAKIGEKYGGGFLSSFLGMDAVSIGIRTTRGFGEVLQELAGGIAAFADFTQFPIKVPDPKDPSKLIYRTVNVFSDIIPPLAENLPLILSTLANVFADIGNQYGGEGGWLSGEDSPVKKGVDAVKGLGTVLSELAGGIVAFANFTEFPIQVPDPKDPSKLIYKAVNLFESIPKIKEALIGDGSIQGKITGKTGILMGLAEVFAEIGNKYGDGFFSDGPVKKGVEAVQGIGGVVSELAQGIIAFANIQRGLPNYGPDGKFNGTFTGPINLDEIKNNITSVLNTIPSVFANVDVDAMNAAKDKANAAVPLAEAISKVGKALQELVVEKKGGEKESLVALIGPGINQIVKDTTNLQLDNEKVKVLDYLSYVLQRFSGLGDGLKTFSTGLISAGEAIAKFGDYIANIPTYVEMLNSLATSLGATGTVIYSFGFDLLKFSDLVTQSDFNDEKLLQLNSLYDVLYRLSSLSPNLMMLSAAMTANGSGFSSFAQGFATFSKQLQNFVTYEKSFSNLVKNAHDYKFNMFARDMGILKENVNAFEVEKLKLTDSMMKSLAILSKDPDALGDTISESIEQAFEKLVDALTEIVDNQQTSQTGMFADLKNSIAGFFGGGTTTQAPTPQPQGNTPAPVNQPGKPGSNSEITLLATKVTGLVDQLDKIISANGIKIDQ
jgi:hypothetical protein